jgi:alpha-galactosidase
MQGRFGFDIDVSQLSEQELEFCKKAVENYKRLGNVIMQGDMYRLISPYDEDRAVLMYVDDNRDKAVLFSYTTNPRYGERFLPTRLQGLDPAKKYNLREINLYGNARPTEYLAISGERLMFEGIQVSSTQPLSSRVFEITVAN